MSRVPPAETTAYRQRVGPAVRLAALTAFIAAGILLMLRYGSDPTAWFAGAGTCPPALFFALVALLPLFGFPLAPLYVFAGAVYGVRLGLPLTLAGIAVHLCLAYPFYGVLLREPASRLLAKRGYRLPEFAPKTRLRATFLIASVPALPFWAQNAVLSLARVPFPLYFAVSFGVHVVIASVVITLGMAARKHVASPWFFFALAVAGTVSGALVWRKYRRRVNRPSPE